jgi:hypothetical protein
MFNPDRMPAVGQNPSRNQTCASWCTYLAGSGAGQSFGFLFEGRNRRTELQKSATAALDGHSQSAISQKCVFAIPCGNIAHGKVVLNVALKQVPTLLADALHDGALGEDYGALLALTPCLRPSQSFPH